MLDREIYEDIAGRTGGDIYIGVVGPVRTGKSTFIRRFAEQMILPYMEEDGARRELTDELPQAGQGRTVMTCEPKFVPAGAAKVRVAENASVNIRLIDCVGFPVDGAITDEEGKPRMVTTPWSDLPMPFGEAAKLGTKKVIRDHATVAVFVTTDGSVADIPRENYAAAEESTVRELKAGGKPFIILVNSRAPQGEGCERVRASLEEKYGVPALAFDCEHAAEGDFAEALERILFEFPVVSVDFDLPDWMRTLPEDSAIVAEALAAIRGTAAKMAHMRDCALAEHMFDGSEVFENPSAGEMRLGEGRARYSIAAKEGMFHKVLSEECGTDVSDDVRLMAYVRSLSKAKAFYGRFSDAVRTADEYGYGIALPAEGDIVLEAPEPCRQGARSGIKLRASAGTYHVVKVNVKSEASPVIGDAARSEEIVRGMIENYEKDPETLWNTELFGRTFKDMVREGLDSKAGGMPEDVRKKMRRTITRIVNEGRGGVICILL